MVLIEVFLELFLEFVIKKLTPRVKQMWFRRQRTVSPSFVHNVDMINRENEQKVIEAAIATSSTQSRIIYFSGPGGCGKTRLLQESERIFHQIRHIQPLQYGPIIDLYHTDLHSVLAIQSAIVETLDPDENHFIQYREARTRFELRRRQGIGKHILNSERKTLNSLFLEDYNALAQLVRPVLRFDTLETLQRESDMIQNLCQLENLHPIEGYSWLIQHCKLFPNSIILLAGRFQSQSSQHLSRVNQKVPGTFEEIKITGLSRADSQELLIQFLQQSSTSFADGLQTHTDLLWQITRGLPVQLAIIVEILLQIESRTELFARLPLDPSEWEKEIVQQMFNYSSELTRPFFFLAMARKGLTVDLLHYLEPGWSFEDCETRLKKLGNLSVIKKREGHQFVTLFLHDVLYELFDSIPFHASKLLPWYEHLVNYHRNYQTLFRENHEEWPKATVNLLYYELLLDPYAAFYDSYLRWSELAIKGNEVELDLQLRDELLRFLHSSTYKLLDTGSFLTLSEVERDSGIRWIKRLLVQAQYPQAIQVATNILKYGPYASLAIESTSVIPVDEQVDEQIETQAAFIFNTTNAFFWGHLLTYYGEALTYIGASEERVRSVLDQALTLLEEAKGSDVPVWLQQRVLGRAYNILAYLEQSYGHYEPASINYHLALDCFSSPELIDEQSDTLNNLAFLLATLGDYQQAKRFADYALKLRQQSGQIYPIALSHNTRGLIYALLEEFDWGERECRLAWDKFAEIEAYRGVGLACNALGFILRHKGGRWRTGEYTVEQVDDIFREAHAYLMQAVEIFANASLHPSAPSVTVHEPIRLWETYNELGSLYCDWADLCKQNRNLTQGQAYYESSLAFQQRALAVAQGYGLHWQLADTYDDLAQLYADWGMLEEAKRQLQYGLQIIADQHRVSQRSITDEGRGEAYWLVLGKAHFQQGVWLLRQTKNLPRGQKKGVAHMIKASFYFSQYWSDTPLLNSRHSAIVHYLRETNISKPELRHQIEKVAKELRKHPEELLDLFARFGR